MENSHKTRFAELIRGMAELHNKKLSNQLLEIYWRALIKYDLHDIQCSLHRLIVDTDVGQFMPKPADIVRSLEGDSESRALMAWSKVMQAIRQVGAWDSVVFDDLKIHAVIMDMGGWVGLCRRPSKDLDFLYHEFKNRYRAYQHRSIEICPPKLLGMLEQSSNSSEVDGETKYIGAKNVNAVLNKLDIGE